MAREDSLFLWLANHGKLLTNEERCRRHLAEDSHHLICNELNESCLHVLRDCPAAYYVWAYLVPRDMFPNFFSLDFDDWFCYNLKSKKQFSDGISWPMIFGVGCWFLWKRRNMEIFDENYVHMGNLFMDIVQYTELIYKSESMTRKFMVHKEEKLIRWNPPSVGWVKLNTDGVLKASSGMTSTGGIIRDKNGNWLAGFAFHIGPSSSL